MVMSGTAEQLEEAWAASGHEAGTSGRTQEAPAQDLAYSIEAPESYENFASLVAGRSAVDLSAAIQRIMACSTVALAAQNRRKLQASVCASDLAGRPRSLSAPLNPLCSACLMLCMVWQIRQWGAMQPVKRVLRHASHTSSKAAKPHSGVMF